MVLRKFQCYSRANVYHRLTISPGTGRITLKYRQGTGPEELASLKKLAHKLIQENLGVEKTVRFRLENTTVHSVKGKN